MFSSMRKGNSVDNLRTALTIIWAVGFYVMLWAVVTDRFRLKPYGLPRPRSEILRQSFIDVLCTLVWFLYVPAWFVYRWATHKRQHELGQDLKRRWCMDDRG